MELFSVLAAFLVSLAAMLFLLALGAFVSSCLLPIMTGKTGRMRRPPLGRNVSLSVRFLSPVSTQPPSQRISSLSL